jgi:hypothetical protein
MNTTIELNAKNMIELLIEKGCDEALVHILASRKPIYSDFDTEVIDVIASYFQVRRDAEAEVYNKLGELHPNDHGTLSFDMDIFDVSADWETGSASNEESVGLGSNYFETEINKIIITLKNWE